MTSAVWHGPAEAGIHGHRRSKATDALTAALTNQFGASATNEIRKQINSRLAGRSSLNRKDLDHVEADVMDALRKRRSCAWTKQALSSSAPNLGLHRSNSSNTAKPERHDSSMRSSGFSQSSKLRVPDHFDLMTDFDADLARRQEIERRTNMQNQQLKVRADLDRQMLEAKQAHMKELEERNADRQNMLAFIEETSRQEANKRKRLTEKQDALKQEYDKMMLAEERRKQTRQERKVQAENKARQWTESEKLRIEQETADQMKQHAARVEIMRHELDSARAERDQRRKAEQDAGQSYFAAPPQLMDGCGLKVSAGIAARQARADRIASSLGEKLAGQAAQDEQELDKRIAKVVAQRDRKAKQEFHKAEKEHEIKVQEMLAVRAEQASTLQNVLRDPR